jgi:hypothetical protein
VVTALFPDTVVKEGIHYIITEDGGTEVLSGTSIPLVNPAPMVTATFGPSPTFPYQNFHSTAVCHCNGSTLADHHVASLSATMNDFFRDSPISRETTAARSWNLFHQ